MESVSAKNIFFLTRVCQTRRTENTRRPLPPSSFHNSPPSSSTMRPPFRSFPPHSAGGSLKSPLRDDQCASPPACLSCSEAEASLGAGRLQTEAAPARPDGCYGHNPVGRFQRELECTYETTVMGLAGGSRRELCSRASEEAGKERRRSAGALLQQAWSGGGIGKQSADAKRWRGLRTTRWLGSRR